MRRWAPIVLVCLFIAYQRGLIRRPVPKNAKTATDLIYSIPSEHSLGCQATGRNKCLVVFLAPWCGACKQFTLDYFPLLLEEMKNHPEAGLEVVVGADTPSAIRVLGLALGMPYIPDTKNFLFNALDLRVYPSFVGIKKDGQVLEVSDGLRSSGNSPQEAVANFARDLLNE